VVGVLADCGVVAVAVVAGLDDVGDEEPDGLPLAAGESESPPQAVTASASAAPAAYRRALDRVIFVTRCSLDSAI
jgi:hypothetical protein